MSCQGITEEEAKMWAVSSQAPRHGPRRVAFSSTLLKHFSFHPWSHYGTQTGIDDSCAAFILLRM
jgi:hypothetical protein